jgi:hypothetical protein
MPQFADSNGSIVDFKRRNDSSPCVEHLKWRPAVNDADRSAGLK